MKRAVSAIRLCERSTSENPATVAACPRPARISVSTGT
jgi:hypothetical protein